MKTNALRIAAALCMSSLALVFSACPCHKHGIVILPVKGAHPNLEKKWPDIQEKLNHFDKDVFYIKRYEKGKAIGGHQGQMLEIFLERSVQEFDDIARATDYDGHAVQIGIGLGKVKSAFCFPGKDRISASTSISHHGYLYTMTSSHAHLVRLFNQSEAAMKELDPIVNETEGNQK